MQNAGGRVEDEREESGHCERECGSFGWCGDVRRTKTRGQQKTTARGGDFNRDWSPYALKRRTPAKTNPQNGGGEKKDERGENGLQLWKRLGLSGAAETRTEQ